MDDNKQIQAIINEDNELVLPEEEEEKEKEDKQWKK